MGSQVEIKNELLDLDKSQAGPISFPAKVAQPNIGAGLAGLPAAPNPS